MDNFWQSLQNTRDFAVDSIAKSASTVQDTVDKARNLILEAASQASENVLEASKQSSAQISESADAVSDNLSVAIDRITDSAREAVAEVSSRATSDLSVVVSQSVNSLENLNDTARQATYNINLVTDRALDTVTETAEQARASLENTIEQTGELGRSIAEAIQLAIASSIQEWLSAHPLVAWLLTHPLYTFGCVILFILLFGGLLRLVNRLTEKVWIYLLQIPIGLFRWLGMRLIGFLKREAGTSNSSEGTKVRRPADVLMRLRELQQEEAELMRELQSLLN